MWFRLRLKTRITLLVSALVLLTLSGGAVMVGYTYRIQGQLDAIVDKDLEAYQLAEALQSALVNQKGFVSYFFLDGDPEWLRQLGEYRQIFRDRLEAARETATGPEEKASLAEIAATYAAYTEIKDRVIGHYKAGERQEGLRIHTEARKLFFEILEDCSAYRNLHRDNIDRARLAVRKQAFRLRGIAAAAMILALVSGGLLILVLAHEILGPVRRLAIAATRDGRLKNDENVVTALSDSVHGLMEDIDRATSKLERSRENLLQAEKMAMVGKLAAGMAHSIRNPFTSVKMRLFSLSRTLEMDPTQREDFDVISEEIRHIDTIVQNFLEFSRPPRYLFQSVSPSVVVDAAVQLLQHRLKSYDVAVEVDRRGLLPSVQADPEQMKEVLANIIVNACEAMPEGGRIRIVERVEAGADGTPKAVVQVSDNGPGIPSCVLEKVFQPFFTTKEDGTGLGLNIAHRIVAEHHGRLEVASAEKDGATFTITLPLDTGKAGSAGG
jgi:signal transduction histidine kinase